MSNQLNQPLRFYDGIGGPSGAPSSILESEANQLQSLLGGPSLIRLKGHLNPPLLIATLLHGDEHSGWIAVQKVLKKWQNKTLPRSMDLFLGNLQAASCGLRFVEGQRDHNRIWDDPALVEHAFVRALKEHVSKNGVFAALDLHNNSGRNPHYACIAQLRSADLHLAGLFSRHVLHMPLPRSMFTVCFASFAPAITCEAGLSGDEAGILELERLIEGVLHLKAHPETVPPRESIDVYQLRARITLHPKWNPVTFPEKCPSLAKVISPSAADSSPRLILWDSLDQHNFCSPKSRKEIGMLHWPGLEPRHLLQAINNGQIPPPFEFEPPCLDQASSLSDRPRNPSELPPSFESMFDIGLNGELHFRPGFTPAMLTPSIHAMKMDCLCYALTRWDEVNS